MNLNQGMEAGMPMAGEASSMNMNRAQAGLTVAGEKRLIGMAGAEQPESELQYAARTAGDSLLELEREVQELAARLQVVLSQEPPQPADSQTGQAQRIVTSQLANALMAHAHQTDAVKGVVRNLLRRLVL
jgi:hypothetical protein